MLRITQQQRDRANNLLSEAAISLRLLCEEKLNLDTATRLAAEAAIDTINAAKSALEGQPDQSF